MTRKAIAIPALLLVSAGMLVAAPAKSKRPAPKPAAKPAEKPSAPSNPFGAALPGQQAELGKLYLMAKAPQRWLVRVKSAEYRVSPMPNRDDPIIPEAEQKLLLVRWTIQNPEKETRPVDWTMFQFTVVDPTNENIESQNTLVDPKGVVLSMELKPTQKVDVVTTLVVPAKGEMPKLMLATQEEQDGVLRFDLRGKVKPLPAGLADPADKSGATALREVPGQPNTYYPTGGFDVRFEGLSEFDRREVVDEELEEGNRWVIVAASLRNATDQAREVDWCTVPVTLYSTAGSEIATNRAMLAETADEALSVELRPGKEVKVRYLFQIPAGSKVGKAMFRDEDEARRIVFAIAK